MLHDLQQAEMSSARQGKEGGAYSMTAHWTRYDMPVGEHAVQAGSVSNFLGYASISGGEISAGVRCEKLSHEKALVEHCSMLLNHQAAA